MSNARKPEWTSRITFDCQKAKNGHNKRCKSPQICIIFVINKIKCDAKSI